MTTKYWVSCKKFTGKVECNSDNVIVDACPFANKFIGQPFTNLTKWMKYRFGDTQVVRLDTRS